MTSPEKGSSAQLSQAMIPSPTRVEQVRQAILRYIFGGDFSPGERLVEATLAKQLGVAQATVNSALQDLHAQGVVTKVLNRSTRVIRYGRDDLDDLFTTRMILEPAAAKAAASNLHTAGGEGLRRRFDEMRAAGRAADLSQFCLADYEFHQELYRLSDNRFLIQACQAIAAAPFAYILCGSLKPLRTDYVSLTNDHEEVIEALIAGPHRAVEVMRKKIARWRRGSMSALELNTAR